jgi:hypothetical protein
MLPIVRLLVLATETTNVAPPLAADPIISALQTGSAAPDDVGVEGKSTFDRLSFDAAGRMRGESTLDQPSGEDRHRGRLRFRVGGGYQVTDSVTARVRFSTLSDGRDANNPHWDFGDGGNAFAATEFGLDRFHLDWAAHENVMIHAGKFGHVFARPAVFGEAMWDDDVQPTGLAEVWKPEPIGESSRFDLRGAQYVAVENGSANDATMFGLQGNFFHDVDEKIHLQVAASFSSWAGEGDGIALGGGNQGNSVGEQFATLETFVQAKFDHADRMSTTAFVQFMTNTDDDSGEDNGFVVGAQYGASGKEKDYNFFGAFYTLDANALYSPVSQDDTPIAGTGVSTGIGANTGMDGLIGGGQYFITDTFSMKLWFLTSNANAEEDPLRIRLDFDFIIK